MSDSFLLSMAAGNGKPVSSWESIITSEVLPTEPFGGTKNLSA